MTTRAHIDLVQIGTATINVDGRPFSATGIALPPAGADALVLRSDGSAQLGGDVTTAVFAEQRLLSLDRAAAGDQLVDGNHLPIEELSVISWAGATDVGLGLTEATDDMPFGELLIGGFSAGGPVTVTLWHMEPKDISVTELTTELAGRLLPATSPDEAHYAVRVNELGTGYVLVRVGGQEDSGPQYATAAQYRARTGATASIEDALLEAELDAAARLIDQELGVTPGHFAPTASATYIFPTLGGSVLTLRDEDGLAYGLRSVAEGGIRPDYNQTGQYDQQAWDLDDDWIWPRARNAVQLGRPYHALEIRRTQRAPLTIWPWSDGSVQITGAWGWAATPTPIRELTIKVARDQRDTLRGGASARVEVMDDGVTYRPDTWRLWAEVKTRYGRRQALAR